MLLTPFGSLAGLCTRSISTNFKSTLFTSSISEKSRVYTQTSRGTRLLFPSSAPTLAAVPSSFRAVAVATSRHVCARSSGMGKSIHLPLVQSFSTAAARSASSTVLRSSVTFLAMVLLGRPVISVSISAFRAEKSERIFDPAAVRPARSSCNGRLGEWGLAMRIQGPLSVAGVVRGGSRCRNSSIVSLSWRA